MSLIRVLKKDIQIISNKNVIQYNPLKKVNLHGKIYFLLVNRIKRRKATFRGKTFERNSTHTSSQRASVCVCSRRPSIHTAVDKLIMLSAL